MTGFHGGGHRDRRGKECAIAHEADDREGSEGYSGQRRIPPMHNAASANAGGGPQRRGIVEVAPSRRPMAAVTA
jgi:hypothetical protein